MKDHGRITTVQSSSTGYRNSFESWSSPTQLAALASAVFLFFGLHNYLQEAIMQQWDYNVMLGYWEVVGVTLGSYWERTYIRRETGRVAPLSAYPFLTALLWTSSALSNTSLNFINFPTKVVFRSCKLIPTMWIATLWHGQRFGWMEYGCAATICAGLVLFVVTDSTVAPTVNHPLGVFLVSGSVVADALLPNAQQKLFRHGSSRLEVTLYTNVLTLGVMTVTTLISGDFVGSWHQMLVSNTSLVLYVAVYTVVAYVAISMHMLVVKRFGGVTAVLVATGRKGLTLIISFVCFPKAFSWNYVLGATMVLVGLLVSSLHKAKSKSNVTSPSDSSSGRMTSNTTNGNPEEETIEFIPKASSGIV